MSESFISKFTKDNIIFKVPWYAEKYPKADDIIIGYIKSIEDGGIKVNILDYMSIEGYMPFQELSKRRVYSIRSLFKEGQIKPLLVLAVDENKGFIDLSNKYVSMAKDDISSLEKYGHLVRIMTLWTYKLFGKNITGEDWTNVMERTLWKLGSKNESYDTFLDIKMGNSRIEDVFPGEDRLDILDEFIQNSITYEIILKIKLKLYTWSINSVSLIKIILNEIVENIPNIKLESIRPPEYEFSVKGTNKKAIVEFHDNIQKMISSIMKQYKDLEYEINKEMEEKIN